MSPTPVRSIILNAGAVEYPRDDNGNFCVQLRAMAFIPIHQHWHDIGYTLSAIAVPIAVVLPCFREPAACW